MKTLKRFFLFAFFLLAAVILFACNGDNKAKEVTVTFDYQYAVKDNKNTIEFKVENGKTLTVEQVATLPNPEKDAAHSFLNWKVEEGADLIKGAFYKKDDLTTIEFTLNTKFVPQFRSIQTAAQIIDKLDESLINFDGVETLNAFKTTAELPNSVDGKNIIWNLTSGEANVELKANKNGRMTLHVKEVPAKLVNAVLKATVTDENGTTASKEFTFKVVPAENAALLQAFRDHFATTIADSEFVLDATTFDFVKKFTYDSKEYNVSWREVSEGKILNVETGAITKPVFKGNEDKPLFDVKVAFAFSGNDSEGTIGSFAFKVKRTLPTITEDINYALDSMFVWPTGTFTEDANGVKTIVELDFQNEITNRLKKQLIRTDSDGNPIEITISWSSNLPEVMDNKGEVVKPSLEQSTDIEYTITTEYAGETFTRKLNFVLPKVELVTTVTALKQSKGKLIAIQGVLTVHGFDKTYFIQDSVGALAVYRCANGSLDKFFGKEVIIIGKKGDYNKLEQMDYVKENLIKIINETADIPAALSIDDEVLGDGLMKHQGKLVSFTNLKVTEKTVDAKHGNITLELYKNDKEKIKFYYDTRLKNYLDATQLQKLTDVKVGQLLSGENVVLGWSTNPQFGPTRLMNLTITTPELTDEERVVEAKKQIEKNVLAEYSNRGDKVTLDAEAFGVTIAWASDNETVINPTTGLVTQDETQDITVKLTATLTRGVVLETWTKDVLVKKAKTAEEKTVANALAAADGTKVTVIGVLTSISSNQAIFLQDTEGNNEAIAVYVSKNTDLAEFVGKKIEIIGTRAAYRGLNQIKDVDQSLIVVIEETPALPTAVNLNDLAELNNTTLLSHQGKLVNLADVTISEKAVDKYGTITFTLTRADDQKMTFKFDNRVFTIAGLDTLKTQVEGLKDGDKITLTNAHISWYDGVLIQPGIKTVITVA